MTTKQEHDPEAFFDAIYHGDCIKVRNMLSQGFSANSINREGETALVYAASHGRDGCVLALLDYGATYEQLPIVDAAVPRDAAVMRRFLQMENDLSMAVLQDALLQAAFYGNTDTVALLLAHGATPHQKSSSGYGVLDAPDEWDCSQEDREKVLSLLNAAFGGGK